MFSERTRIGPSHFFGKKQCIYARPQRAPPRSQNWIPHIFEQLPPRNRLLNRLLNLLITSKKTSFFLTLYNLVATKVSRKWAKGPEKARAPGPRGLGPWAKGPGPLGPGARAERAKRAELTGLDTDTQDKLTLPTHNTKLTVPTQ